MQPIAIADRLWLEPTLLGATLNYAEGPGGFHFKVGIGFDSLLECDRIIKERRYWWVMGDGSLSVFGNGSKLVLTFSSPSDPLVQRRMVLSGEVLRTFKSAIQFLGLAVQSRLN